MTKQKFTKSHFKDLIDLYKLDLEKLKFRVDKVKEIIKGLKEELKKAPEDAVPAPKKKPGRKKAVRKTASKKSTAKKAAATKKTAAKKSTAKKTTTRKTAAKKSTAKKTTTRKTAAKKPAAKKSTGTKGRAGRKPVTTVWDTMVMAVVKEAKKGLTSSQLFEAVKAKAKKAKEYKNDVMTKALINRALQKLVNRQKILAKFKYEGRGYAYGLPEWGSRGKLKPEHKVEK